MKTKSASPIRKAIAMSALAMFGIIPAFAQDNPLGQFDGHGDVGAPKNPGSRGL